MRKYFERIGVLDSTISTAQYIAQFFQWLLILGGGGMSGIAALSSPSAESLGLVFPIGVFVIVSLALALIFWLFQSARARAISADVERMLSAGQRTINPLENHFEDQIIPIGDLRLPGRQVHAHKTFLRCHFVGPGVIAFMGGTLKDSTLNENGSIIAYDMPVILIGPTVLEDCIVRECHFYRVQLMMPREQTNAFRQEGMEVHISGDPAPKQFLDEQK